MYSLKRTYRKTKRELFMSKFIRSSEREHLSNKLRRLADEKAHWKCVLDKLQSRHN